MSKDRIAVFPYRVSGTDYIVTMQRLLQKEFDLVDYFHLKYGLWSIDDVTCIYINWLEDYLDELDRKLLNQAATNGTKIVWVFHNRVTHDIGDKYQISINNIQFLAGIANHIIIHSKNSGRILEQICNTSYEFNKDRLVYIPHPNYVGDYGAYIYPNRHELDGICKINDSYTYGFIGQMRPYKNIEILIKAYISICDRTDSRLIMAGGFHDKTYLKKIKELCDGCSNIELYPNHISSLEMRRLIECFDVMVLPYDLMSSMNSGSMILAFSNKKTVIVPDICMADDFPDDLIFKYHYENDSEHEEVLKTMMEKSYRHGKEEMRKRGEKLFEIVQRDNSKVIVGERLLSACLN